MLHVCTQRSAKQKVHFRAVIISPRTDNYLATRGQLECLYLYVCVRAFTLTLAALAGSVGMQLLEVGSFRTDASPLISRSTVLLSGDWCLLSLMT